MMNLQPMRLIELIAALAILGVGIALYRRKPAKDEGGVDGSGYGSQGAVILFAIAAIMAVHALGGMDYRPTQSEIDVMKARTR